MLLYGWHTVRAALDVRSARIRRLLATENAARRLADDGGKLPLEPELVRPNAIAALVGPEAVHNGLYAEADPLPSPGLDEIEPAGVALVLDQITDPHNVGAILRTAAAFAVSAVVTTARHSGGDRRAGEIGLGALEYVPMVTVQNLARALAELKGAATSPSGSTAAATPASPRRRCGRRSRWCSAPRARACGN